MRLKFGLAIIGILTVAMPTAYAGGSSVEISQSEYGDKWPFTVSRGRLECIPSSKVVFHARGRTYAVNGVARNDYSLDNMRDIWRKDPNNSGLT